MESSEYLPMFLAEGREHLQELNLAVVRIEEEAGDQETVDEIFRIAHSLKGMTATMGFAGMAALTHGMEDESIKCGACDFVVKPLQADRVIEAVGKALA